MVASRHWLPEDLERLRKARRRFGDSTNDLYEKLTSDREEYKEFRLSEDKTWDAIASAIRRQKRSEDAKEPVKRKSVKSIISAYERSTQFLSTQNYALSHAQCPGSPSTSNRNSASDPQDQLTGANTDNVIRTDRVSPPSVFIPAGRSSIVMQCTNAHGERTDLHVKASNPRSASETCSDPAGMSACQPAHAFDPSQRERNSSYEEDAFGDALVVLFCFQCTIMVLIYIPGKATNKTTFMLERAGMDTFELIRCKSCSSRASLNNPEPARGPNTAKNAITDLQISKDIILGLRWYDIASNVCGGSPKINTDMHGIIICEDIDMIRKGINNECKIFGLKTDVARSKGGMDYIGLFVPGGFF